ncbi:MAG: Stk1 family PASTA domain-containing Ser/Thr kinase [Coriobacteriia bacterium]|nr:Stk1 family PASTA domain-containing Ser/Thr kinase [Coriobacteriia bacterium]
MEDVVFGRRYRVIEKIGSGGMADVFKAVDDVLGRTVAVKVLHARYAADPTFVARFRQEAQAAANLSHPNIVNMYDWGRDGETYYIVMEYVKGTDLKSLVSQQGPMDPRKAAEYAAQICSALAVAHGYDIIHRDIKPHNIVLTPDGTIKVMDFGIARAGNTTMTQTGSVLGTAQYISPEQAQGRQLSPASDLYSLGVTLYEMVTGRPPFDADTPVATALQQVNDEPMPPRQVRASIPPALEAVILRAMRKNPAERYDSAAEMRDDLRRAANGDIPSGGVYAGAVDAGHTSVLPAVERSASARPAGAPQIRPVPERRSSPWPWIALVAAVLVVALGVAYALGVFGPGGIVVPTLAGLTEDEAQAELEAAGLTLGIVGVENHDTVEPGLIISQDPAAGDEVEEGTAVNIVVSQGIAQVAVPDLTEYIEADAIAALRSTGELAYDHTEDEHSSTVAKGLVIRTEPAAGASVPKGTSVILYVSLGVEQVTVPDVTGLTLAKAQAQLEDLGLKVTTTEAFNDTVAKGSVISQKPDANVLLEAGRTITLEISKGPEVIIVPDVRTMNEEDAKKALTDLGLEPKVVYVTSPDEGIVVNQFPIPGASAKRGDVIEIEVGKLPDGDGGGD